MKRVSKGKLKARMLEFFREIESTGEHLIVTDRGREVLVVQPMSTFSGAFSKDMTLREPSPTVPYPASKDSQESILAELRILATPLETISEEELMAPLPLEDWEVEPGEDRNPWS